MKIQQTLILTHMTLLYCRKRHFLPSNGDFRSQAKDSENKVCKSKSRSIFRGYYANRHVVFCCMFILYWMLTKLVLTVPQSRISEAVSKDPIQTMKLDVRQPTSTLKNSVQMPSARMQSKLPCELSDVRDTQYRQKAQEFIFDLRTNVPVEIHADVSGWDLNVAYIKGLRQRWLHRHLLL